MVLYVQLPQWQLLNCSVFSRTTSFEASLFPVVRFKVEAHPRTSIQVVRGPTLHPRRTTVARVVVIECFCKHNASIRPVLKLRHFKFSIMLLLCAMLGNWYFTKLKLSTQWWRNCPPPFQVARK